MSQKNKKKEILHDFPFASATGLDGMVLRTIPSKPQ
jgi:hypothetical protein